jgi:hypothetical protein
MVSRRRRFFLSRGAERRSVEERSDSQTRKAWEPMKLSYVGDAGDVLEGGGGKKSPTPFDPGEIFKPPGHAG